MKHVISFEKHLQYFLMGRHFYYMTRIIQQKKIGLFYQG
jgi:hypothetical protein